MLPLHRVIWHEWTSRVNPERVPEVEIMNDDEQVKSYVKAYEWGGPTSALQLHHLKELSQLIRPGDRVLDLACGPGPLLLELAVLYPDVQFIGVDLSPRMLAHLEREIQSKKLKNLKTVLADICTLQPQDLGGAVDLVISTSALHHLPEVSDLQQVFQNISSLLQPAGGFYFFDFALLKSEKTRQILVKELSLVAPPLTTLDYEVSLRAAFPLATVFDLARAQLPQPMKMTASAFVDFFYFIQSPPRVGPSLPLAQKIEEIGRRLSLMICIEHLMLRLLRRRL